MILNFRREAEAMQTFSGFRSQCTMFWPCGQAPKASVKTERNEAKMCIEKMCLVAAAVSGELHD